MLSPLKACLIADVIEECFSQVKIIMQISQMANKNKSQQAITSAVDEKKTEEEEEDDFLYTVKEPTPQEKFDADRNVLEEVLKDVTKELRNTQSYNRLVEFVEQYKQERKDYQDFYERVLKELEMIPKLRKDVIDTKKAIEKEQDDMDRYIDEIKFELQKLKARTEMEKRYVSECIKNDIEMTFKKCSEDEDELRDEIKCLEERLELEAEIDNEVSKSLQHKQEEFKKTLTYWKCKFYDDMTLKEKEITTMKKYKKLNVEKIANLTREIQKAKDFLENDRKEKQRQREIEKEERKRLEATIRIQAWWRGTMFRNKLGPYAEKKKKKGKKDKKGKKGKGKKK